MLGSAPRYVVGTKVVIKSKTSKYKNQVATIVKYCDGIYRNICTVELENKHKVNYKDTSLDLI